MATSEGFYAFLSYVGAVWQLTDTSRNTKATLNVITRYLVMWRKCDNSLTPQEHHGAA